MLEILTLEVLFSERDERNNIAVRTQNIEPDFLVWTFGVFVKVK